MVQDINGMSWLLSGVAHTIKGKIAFELCPFLPLQQYYPRTTFKDFMIFNFVSISIEIHQSAQLINQ